MTALWGIVSFSGLKTLFFDHIQPWQHLTLLTQQIQLLLWQQCSQNSFWTSHQSHSWPHPLTGTPRSNMMISSYFTNQWKVGSPFRIFQQKQPQELDPMQNPTCNLTGICAQFPGQHWPQEIWPLEADWHSRWDFKEEKASFSLHGLLVLYNGSCSVTMLQDLSTGRCSHPTWRVTRWTNWPSLCSCWLMQLSIRWGKGMEHPVQTHQSPKWQGTHQEAACTWPEGNHTQDAQSVPDTHCYLRQPWGHGIEGTEDSQVP